MKWSLKLGKVKGIEVEVHWTFLILLIWVFFSHLGMGHPLGQALTGLGFIIVLFACVLLHEFGHALMGMRYGIRTRNIVLLPIGGVANMEKMPENPLEELWVALAGPAVNAIIAGVLLLGLWWSEALPTALELDHHMDVSNFWLNLFFVNVLLVVFNMLPAFPMDGGRVFRALLALKMERYRATEIAARTGQFLAILFVFVGLFFNVWLVFIGLFVFLGAGAEFSQESTHSVLSKYRVKDVLMKKFTILDTDDPIDKAVEQLLNGQEKEFLVQEKGRIKGYLTRDEIIKGLRELGKDAPLSSILRTDFSPLSPELSLEQAHEIMSRQGVSFAPVFKDGKLEGVLDMENITELLLVDKALSPFES